jgi:flagellar basal-body rod protein FlgF
MDPLLISAASGMRSRMESLEMLANNLANATTGGYKTDREFYSLYVAAEAAEPADEGLSPDPDALPIIEKHWTDYSQGNLRETGNALDVALEGSGFFAANGPSGVVYTRNGSFRANAAGLLTTSDGYPLRSAAGATIAVAPQTPVDIGVDGTIQQNGQAIGQLAVLDFPDRGTIDKRGLNYFVNSDPTITGQPSTAVVHQRHLEESNVGPAETAVRLVSVMRQFESLQKAMTVGTDMNKYAIEEVARVSQ